MSDSIVAAVVAARQEMAPLIADKTANMGKYTIEYASLPQLLRVVMPALLKQGLMLVQRVHNEGSGVSVETKIINHNGEHISSGVLSVPCKDDAIEMGKAATTLCRIQLRAFLGLGIGDDDDDTSEQPPVSQVDRQRQAAQPAGRPVEMATTPCPECHAPAGKPHATGCSVNAGGARGRGERATSSPNPVANSHDDVDFGMDKGEPVKTEIAFVSGLMENPFYQDELQASGIHMEPLGHYRKWDSVPESAAMPTTPSPGKKMSMYSYLAMLIDRLCDAKGAHNIVLSYLLGRPVHSKAPPPLSMRVLIDELTSSDDGVKEVTENVIRTIYETCKVIWEEAHTT